MSNPAIRYLVLWLTGACNLRCRYCYRKADTALVMSKGVIRKALTLAAVSGLPFHVQLSGGEAMLEPDLVEFVGKTVRDAGWPATVAVQTNGTLMSESLIRMCRRYAIRIGVSVDGPPDLQEKVRGKAKDLFNGLGLLEKMGEPVRITAVLSSFNAHRLEDLVLTLARFNNVTGIGLDPLVLTGAAQGAFDLQPEAEAVRTGVRQMAEAVTWVNGRNKRNIVWREMDLVGRTLSHEEPVRPYCHACSGESLAVGPGGEAYPCAQTIGDRAMTVGTVQDINWKRLTACYKDVVGMTGECMTCSLAGRCPGDCLSRLYYNAGKVPSVMCVVYRAIAERLTEKHIRRNLS